MSDGSVVRCVSWRELCPWLVIFRVFRLAISPPVLMIATLGTLLAAAGHYAADVLCPRPGVMEPALVIPLDPHPSYQRVLSNVVVLPETDRSWGAPVTEAIRSNVAGVYWTFFEPVPQLLRRDLPWRPWIGSLLRALWNLMVWSFFGAAIVRIAVVQLGRDERIRVKESLTFAARKYGWLVVAPLFPLVFVIVSAIPILVVGWLMRFAVGVAVAGLLWWLMLLLGLIVAITLLGLACGWPLMWPAIAAEPGGDCFEAFSRSYAYTFQRPLHYLFYAAVTVVFGVLSWWLVVAMAEMVMACTQWIAFYGSGWQRAGTLMRSAASDSMAERLGVILILASHVLVRAVAAGFNFSFFFCAASAVYLLLRRDTDQTEMDEVYVEEEARRYGLPPLTEDDQGVPGVGGEMTETRPASKDGES